MVILNGNVVAMLVGIIGALLGLVQLLFGIILKMHSTRDDERFQMAWEEVQRLRQRLHDVANERFGRRMGDDQ